MAVEAMSADSFRSNFINSYIGNLQGLDTEEKKKFANIRGKEAEGIADEIVKATLETLKAKGIKNSDFAFSILNSKIRTEGYEKLVSSGSKVNVESINGILKKEIEQQLEVQKRQAEEQEKGTASEINLENEALKEQEVKEQLGQMDFDNLSFEDMAYIGENLENALKNMTKEEADKFAEKISTGQKEEVKKYSKEMIEIVQKHINGQEFTSDEEALLKAKADEFGITQEGFLQKYGKALQNVTKIEKDLKASFVEIIKEQDGNLTQEKIKEILDSEEVKKYSEYFNTMGFDQEDLIKFVIGEAAKVYSKETGKKASIPMDITIIDEDFIDFNESIIGNQSNDVVMQEDYFMITEQFSDGVSFGDDMSFLVDDVQEKISEQQEIPSREDENVTTFEEINPNEITIKMIEKFVDHEMDIAIDPHTEDVTLSEQLDEQLSEQEQPITPKVEPTFSTGMSYDSQVLNENVEPESSLEDKTYESPTEEVKTWREKLAESKNPVLRAFSKIFNINKKEALPPSQGNLRAQNFDAENKETMGLSEARDGVISPIIAIRNQINRGMENLFRLGKRKEAQENTINSTGLIQNIKPKNSFDESIKASDKVQDIIAHPQQLIPTEKKVENARTSSKENGIISLDD